MPQLLTALFTVTTAKTIWVISAKNGELPIPGGGTTRPAATVQRTQYYPSRLPWKSNSGDNPGSQPYKYGGKEFVEMHGLDEYDSEARWYYPAIMRTTTPDPLAEMYYDISPYAWCANNPVKNVDPNGMWIESAWDVFSLVTGAKSLVNNIRQGNVGAAIVDGLGVAADGLALALPGIPGGVGAGIKAIRAGDNVLDAVSTAKTVENATDMGKVAKVQPNPHGAKGKPDHQAKVKELETKAANENPGQNIVTEKKINAKGSNRRPDVQVQDPKQNNKTTKVYEAERNPNSKRNQKREEEYRNLGIPYETHKVSIY